MPFRLRGYKFDILIFSIHEKIEIFYKNTIFLKRTLLISTLLLFFAFATRVANDIYQKYSINEYTRVPLYELVYHDAVVTSWRWEDGNHHTTEICWKKDLFNMLYGSAPLWNLDRECWNEYKYTFIESYKNVCPWLQQIETDELISHRFVTANHKVQESVFSSGKKIIVNFGDSDFLYEGKSIVAKGFLTY